MRLLGRRRDRPPFRRAARSALALADRFPTRGQFDRERIGDQSVPDPRHPRGRTRKIDAPFLDQARRFGERPRIFATRLLDRMVDDALVIEFSRQLLSRRGAFDTIDVDGNAGREVVIVAVAGLGAPHTRPDRGELQPTGYRLHVEIGVQRDGEGRGDEGAGNADAVADLEAVIGRIERNCEVMVDHRALRRLSRCCRTGNPAKGRQNGNDGYSCEGWSHKGHSHGSRSIMRGDYRISNNVRADLSQVEVPSPLPGRGQACPGHFDPPFLL